RLPAPLVADRLSRRAGALSDREHAVHDRGLDPILDRDQLRDFLFRVCAAGIETGLEEAAPIPAFRHVARDGAFGHEHAGRPRSLGEPQEPVSPHAQVSDRTPGGSLARKTLPLAARRLGASRDCAGALFRVDDVEPRPRESVRAAAVFPSLPLWIPLRGSALARPRARAVLIPLAAGPHEPPRG